MQNPLISTVTSYANVNLNYRRDNLESITKAQNPCECKVVSFFIERRDMNLNLDYKTIQDEEKINRLRNEL